MHVQFDTGAPRIGRPVIQPLRDLGQPMRAINQALRRWPPPKRYTRFRVGRIDAVVRTTRASDRLARGSARQRAQDDAFCC
jgi:hypothetical protein